MFPNAMCPQEGCGSILMRSVSMASSGCSNSMMVQCLQQPVRIYDVPPLHDLPEALAVIVMTFLDARSICRTVRRVDRAWRFLSCHNGMWKVQCDITEKMALLPPNPRLPWEFMYLGNPHVPRDFDKIQDAINNAFRGGNVFVAAGEYREHLTLSRDVNVRATASAMAQGGVSIAYRTPRQDVPAVTIKGGNVNFIGLKFTHGCRGQDIWNGNSALLINGPSVATLDECEVTSTSGRGVVATLGARLTLNNCFIHDSAATGVYIGGEGTHGSVTSCLVRENGKGGAQVPGQDSQVLRGHSGIFIDRSTFHIKDSSVIHNHLTGISLVGDGSHAIIEDTQISGNATLPIDAAEDRIELRGENDITEGNAP